MWISNPAYVLAPQLEEVIVEGGWGNPRGAFVVAEAVLRRNSSREPPDTIVTDGRK